MKSRSGLVIALGGMALLVASSAAQAGDWFCWCSHCTAPVKVNTSQCHPIEFIGEGHPVCDPCSIRYYATCWRHAMPANYSHCHTVSLCAPVPTMGVPLAPDESLPAPAKEDELPKPKPKVDKLPKSDTKDPKDTKDQSQQMEVINHGYGVPSPKPMSLPIIPPTPSIR